MSSKDVAIGSAMLVLSSVGFIAMIPGAIGMGLIALLGMPFSVGARGIASGLTALAKPQVFIGALAIAAIGAAFIPLAFAMSLMQGIEWKTLGVAIVTLIAFSAAAFALGALMMSGVGAVAFLAGAAAIAVLGAAMLVFGIGAKKVSEAMVPLAGAFTSMLDPIKSLSEYGPKLILAAAGIAAVGVAMAAFGAGSAYAGVGVFVGKLFGGDTFGKLKDLAGMSDQLFIVADALKSIQESLASFANIDASNLTTIVGQVKELKGLNQKSVIGDLLDVAKFTKNTVLGTNDKTEKGNSVDNTEVVKKLDELIGLLKSGAIGVNMDGRKVSSTIAANTGR
jgi:hypothetical protein